jgi:transcription factor C subunit 7
MTEKASQHHMGKANEGRKHRDKIINISREWYGRAYFDHPSPASPTVLKAWFPTYDTSYSPSIIPSYQSKHRSRSPHPLAAPDVPLAAGESICQLHDRCAYALARIIAATDAETGSLPTAIVVVTHAATLIAAGRALTGRMPENVNEEDFRPFTCSISKFVRRTTPDGHFDRAQPPPWRPGMLIPNVDWRGGKGVAGGWNCILNGDCSHLDGGEERGW